MVKLCWDLKLIHSLPMFSFLYSGNSSLMSEEYGVTSAAGCQDRFGRQDSCSQARLWNKNARYCFLL